MEILTIFLADYIKSSDPDLDDQVTFWGKLFKTDVSQQKNIWQMTTECCIIYQGHKWSLSAFLKHLKANNIDTVQLMQSIEDVIIKVFVIIKKIFCKYPVDHQDLINIQSFYFVNILSITCRRSSALSFRWTQPARCLSLIGTHQLLQFCILYLYLYFWNMKSHIGTHQPLQFCILYLYFWNMKYHIGTYQPCWLEKSFSNPFSKCLFSNFCWSGIIVLSSTDLIFW